MLQEEEEAAAAAAAAEAAFSSTTLVNTIVFEYMWEDDREEASMLLFHRLSNLRLSDEEILRILTTIFHFVDEAEDTEALLDDDAPRNGGIRIEIEYVQEAAAEAEEGVGGSYHPDDPPLWWSQPWYNDIISKILNETGGEDDIIL